MKKSFFLPLIAALAAIFSFSACSSGDDVKEETVLTACEWREIPTEIGIIGTMCIEVISGISAKDVREIKEACPEEDEDLGVGIVHEKCPEGERKECPYTEYGIKMKAYIYDEMLGLLRLRGGECPPGMR
jgi:hypothetical protein